jgi:hypothetical protein
MSTPLLHQASNVSSSVVDAEKARYVAGTLALLIDVVHADPILTTVLRQARNEVVSLIPSPKAVVQNKRIVRRAA